MSMDMYFLQLLNGSDSLFLDRFTVAFTSGYTWIPFYVILGLLIVKNNKTMAQIMLIFACGILGVLASGVFCDLVVKPYFMHPRPCFDPAVSHMVKTVSGYKVTGYSFFSSQAANTMSLAVFFTFLVRSKLLSVTLFLWSIVSCWTSLYLGVYWFSDIAFGMLWGMFIGILVYFIFYKIFRKMSPSLNYISTHYTSTGYSRTDIDMCLSMMTLTLMYCLFRVII